MKNVRLQSGHAAMLFVMMVPVLFGVFTLGTDGSRALQSKARLSEAFEVASLAVAAQDSDDDNTRISTVKAYLEYYFPNATITDSDITVTKITCDEDSDSTSCPDFDADTDTRYFKYTVTGTISETTWFPGNEAIIGFGEDYNVASSSVAKKYQSQTIDIVYVADFSGSMGWTLSSATGDDVGLDKYEILINIINEVNEEVKAFNDSIVATTNTQSTVGFTAFNLYTHGETSNGSECGVDSWVYTTTTSGKGKNKKTTTSLDAESTAAYDNVFAGGSDCDGTSGSYIYGTFEDIALTEDFGSSDADFETTIADFTPQGGTSSTQGIIAGAKIAYQGTNARKLIIILSDGADTSTSNTKSLVDAGLCDTITSTLDAQISSEGEDVVSRIALIGFDYDTDDNEGLTDCVGGSSSGNIYEASSGDELKSAILSLISEEIGHLAD
jgi:tight adherence protein G